MNGFKTLARGLGIIGVGVGFGWGCASVSEDETANPEAIAKGRELFVQKECVSCHDVRGEFPDVSSQLVVNRIELAERMRGKNREEWKFAIQKPAHGRSMREWLPLEELTAMMIRSRRLTSSELGYLVDFLSAPADSAASEELE